MAIKKTEKEKIEEQEREFENQIINYNILGITKSKRGQAVLFILAFSAITLALVYFDVFNFDVIYGVIIYLILAIFIYKGHRWAIIGTMIMWTGDKIYQISTMNITSPISIFFWWIVLMIPLYNAIKIENERRKRDKSEEKLENTQPVLANDDVAEKKRFCSKCGKEINSQGMFCKFCGNKLS